MGTRRGGISLRRLSNARTAGERTEQELFQALVTRFVETVEAARAPFGVSVRALRAAADELEERRARNEPDTASWTPDAPWFR